MNLLSFSLSQSEAGVREFHIVQVSSSSRQWRLHKCINPVGDKGTNPLECFGENALSRLAVTFIPPSATWGVKCFAQHCLIDCGSLLLKEVVHPNIELGSKPV